MIFEQEEDKTDEDNFVINLWFIGFDVFYVFQPLRFTKKIKWVLYEEFELPQALPLMIGACEVGHLILKILHTICTLRLHKY